MGIKIIVNGADFSENGFSLKDMQKTVDEQLSKSVLLAGASVGKAGSVNAISQVSNRTTLLVPINYALKEFPGTNAFAGIYSLILLPAGLKSVTIKTDAITSVKHGLVLANASTAVNEYDSGWKATGTIITKSFDSPTDHDVFLASSFDHEISKTVDEIHFTVTVEY